LQATSVTRISHNQALLQVSAKRIGTKLDSAKCLIVICAHNEAKTLPYVLEALKGRDVLLVDDGSHDETKEIARTYGATVLAHDGRLGKVVSLADGISFALQNSYGTIIEIDADAIPKPGTLQKLVSRLSNPDVGAVSCRQVPIGRLNPAYHVDEFIWSLLAHGKKVQMESNGSCHLGAVLVAFKTDLVDSIEGSVNDDEQIGVSIEKSGHKISFVEDAVVYFDASSCLGHIVERRRRMYYGHMKFAESTAPSMQISTAIRAIVRSLVEEPKRVVWSIPAMLIDFYSRLMAWRDARNPIAGKKYNRWVTTYAKNNSLVIRSCPDK
jgi:cellulose synthase/poly-beta-1,6-N-acetylglucosamine synthase-like glycosyltransferase